MAKKILILLIIFSQADCVKVKLIMFSVNFCGGPTSCAAPVIKKITPAEVKAAAYNSDGTCKIPFQLPKPITWSILGQEVLKGGKTQTKEISSEGRIKTTTTGKGLSKKIVEDLGSIKRVTIINRKGETILDTTIRKTEEELQKSLHLIG